MDGMGTIPPSTAISAPKFYLQAACDRFDIDTRSSETVHSLSNVEDAKCLARGHSTSANAYSPKINMSPKKGTISNGNFILPTCHPLLFKVYASFPGSRSLWATFLGLSCSQACFLTSVFYKTKEHTLPETNSSHLNIGDPKRKLVFQPIHFQVLLLLVSGRVVCISSGQCIDYLFNPG